MKRTTVILCVLLLGAGRAAAADREGAREFFRRIDTNGDRKIEFSEIQAARAKLFDRMDTNRNGILEADELKVAAERAKARRGNGPRAQLADLQTRKAEMDINHDGAISRDEFASFIPARLAQADANGDHALSLLELRSLRRQ